VWLQQIWHLLRSQDNLKFSSMPFISPNLLFVDEQDPLISDIVNKIVDYILTTGPLILDDYQLSCCVLDVLKLTASTSNLYLSHKTGVPCAKETEELCRTFLASNPWTPLRPDELILKIGKKVGAHGPGRINYFISFCF